MNKQQSKKKSNLNNFKVEIFTDIDMQNKCVYILFIMAFFLCACGINTQLQVQRELPPKDEEVFKRNKPPQMGGRERIELNFCRAKAIGNKPFRKILTSNPREFDSGGLLPVGTKYFYMGNVSFLELNSLKKISVTMPVNVWDDRPNVLLPVTVFNPSETATNLFGVGAKLGIEYEAKAFTDFLESDLNGDGFLDLVLVDYGDHDVKEFKGGKIDVGLWDQATQKYKISRVSNLRQSHHRTDVFDIDGDGDNDIVTAGRIHGKDTSTRRGNITVFVNNDNGQFKEKKSLLSNQAGRWFVEARDIDLDGNSDIILGGWGKIPHLVLFDKKINGAKATINLPGKEQEILSVTVHKKDGLNNLYLFTTHEYEDFNLYRASFKGQKVKSVELILTKNRNNRDFGYAHPNRIFRCNESLNYFREMETNQYFNRKNGFTVFYDIPQ